MTFGILFDGMSDANDFMSFAREAEQMGVRSVWMAEHFCFRDALVTATALTSATKLMEVVPGPLSPYARHPITIAMGIQSLAELAPGRVGLNLGTGNIGAQQECGIDVDKPLTTMKEAIESIRALLSGDFVHLQAERFHFHGAKMGFKTGPIPLYLSAIGPKMLASAGRYADGVVLSAGLSPQYVTRSLRQVDDARILSKDKGSPFRRIGLVVTSAAPDTRTAYDAGRGLLSYLFRTPLLAEDWALNHIHIDHQAIAEAIKLRDWERAKTYVPDEAITLHSISGSPTEFRARFQAYLKAGYDQPVLMLVGTPENRRLALRLALEASGNSSPETGL